MNDIQHAMQAIVAAAYEVSAAGIAHVFVDYSGHVDCLRIYAYPAGTEYAEGVQRERIFVHDIPLYAGAGNPMSKLDAALRDILALSANEVAA